jgi:uncharacterized protein YkwD
MRQRVLGAAVAALAMLVVSTGCSERESNAANRANADGAATPVPQTILQMEAVTHERINAFRQDEGRPPLVRTAELDELARRYSCQMASEDFFAHEAPDGDTISDRAEQAAIDFRVIGENLAYTRNISDPVDFSVEGWKKSEGHRRNILDQRYEETGIGVCEARKNEYYITQVFRKG